MKFISASGFRIISSDLGDPNRIHLSKAERSAFIQQALIQAVSPPATTDFQSLTDSVLIELGYLWNWPAAGATFGDVRADPLLGWVLTFANSDLTRVIGAQMTVEYSWKSQPTGGYGVGAPPTSIVHTALVEFEKVPSGLCSIGLIPGMIANGRTILGLPRISTSNTGNYVKVSGIPLGTTARARVLTRHDAELINLFPDIVEELYSA